VPAPLCCLSCSGSSAVRHACVMVLYSMVQRRCPVLQRSLIALYGLACACRPTASVRTAPCLYNVLPHVQVYVPVPRRASSEGLLAPKTRPLTPKLEALLEIVQHFMREKWGGADKAQCTAKMLAAASRLGTGLEAA
jgi:hypothetical protein